jgi:hypothetical protein
MSCPTGKTSLAPQLPIQPSARATVAPPSMPAARAAKISARSLLMTNPPDLLVGRFAAAAASKPGANDLTYRPSGHARVRFGEARRCILASPFRGKKGFCALGLEPVDGADGGRVLLALLASTGMTSRPGRAPQASARPAPDWASGGNRSGSFHARGSPQAALVLPQLGMTSQSVSRPYAAAPTLRRRRTGSNSLGSGRRV